MHDDTVTTSWKRLTDKVNTPLGGEDPMSLAEGAPSSASPAHAPSTAAGCRTGRDNQATQQAAQLATWEDEGGTAVVVD